MDIEETLNWMCKYIAYWYIEEFDKKEVVYPLNKQNQKIVQNILQENADIIIFEDKVFIIKKEVEKNLNKTSYMYFMKKATAYIKNKIRIILPYDLKEEKLNIMKKMFAYSKKNYKPVMLVSIVNFEELNSILVKNLNPFTYINLNNKTILVHKDMYILIGDNVFILLFDLEVDKLNKKYYNLKKELNNNVIIKKHNTFKEMLKSV